jgi:holliday junction DNA helicase RuvA
MIARLSGRLIERQTDWGVIDVNGVGYEVFTTDRNLESWQGAEDVIVHVHTVVREDALALFGFASVDERTAFRVLIGVSGCGPKMALSALNTYSVADLTASIEADDVVALSKINGVGKKKAQRLALELKGKMPASFVAAGAKSANKKRGPIDQLPLALARLDYGKSEIDRALVALKQRGIAADAQIQVRLAEALKILSGQA